MGYVEVRDYVIWTPHIRGAPELAARLEALRAGQMVKLRIDGVSGLWEKMRDQPDGKKTPGLKPHGEVAKYWRSLFEKRRGDLVEVSLESAGSAATEAASAMEREAAWAALKALAAENWRSEAPYGSRDDLHERQA